jgi:uncharacterized protein YndB with AHSA1/START domain
MERTTERLSLQREIEIAAAPETVWEFLVDPDKARRWWGTSVFVDLRPEGRYRVELSRGRTVVGEFVELDPPRRLVYSFGWEAGSGDLASLVPPGSSTVEIELIPRAGGTTLRIVHRDLPDAESLGSHGGGWDHYLERLSIAAAGGDPGPDPWSAGEM